MCSTRCLESLLYGASMPKYSSRTVRRNRRVGRHQIVSTTSPPGLATGSKRSVHTVQHGMESHMLLSGPSSQLVRRTASAGLPPSERERVCPRVSYRRHRANVSGPSSAVYLDCRLGSPGRLPVATTSTDADTCHCRLSITRVTSIAIL